MISQPNITYRTHDALQTAEIVAVYQNAGLNRPVDDLELIGQMYQNSNLVISAWDGDQLIGVARSLTDFCYCCYLSDLAVKQDYQKLGIGKRLIELTRKAIGEGSMLLLLSAPGAMDYYPKVGFDKVENGFMIKRKV
ncbi:GNAT family N-acetyltransferase [soil metagenome]